MRSRRKGENAIPMRNIPLRILVREASLRVLYLILDAVIEPRAVAIEEAVNINPI